MVWARRIGEGLAMLTAGYLVGLLATSWPSDTAWVLLIATIGLALGGRLMFDGTFNWAGLGLILSSEYAVFAVIRDFADRGGT